MSVTLNVMMVAVTVIRVVVVIVVVLCTETTASCLWLTYHSSAASNQ